MRTVGVDLSASKQRTATASIEWDKDSATVVETSLKLGDDDLVQRFATAEWVGIDAPFGWPEQMVAAVHDYAMTGRWSGVKKEAFRFRCTDRFVNQTVLEETGCKFWPLSVSADRLALTAWRTAQLRERAFEGLGVRFDRAGADRVVEVYPAAALLLWGIERRPYKTSRDPDRREEEGNARAALLAAIEAQAPWLGWAEGTREACVAGDDALDAVLAALIARAAALGLTVLPENGDLELARSEGWIHLPQVGSLPELLRR